MVFRSSLLIIFDLSVKDETLTRTFNDLNGPALARSDDGDLGRGRSTPVSSLL